MKTLLLVASVAAVASLSFAPGAQAQYKAPSQYFPKNSPVPTKPGGQPQPGSQPQAPRQTPPPAPAQPKFKDLAVNSQFYFLADTNRAFAWTKISGTTAKNTKNGVTQTINAETVIQR